MMTVKEVSNLTGVSIRTLQYYDKIGLLHPAHRTQAGYRLYDDAALERLQQILHIADPEKTASGKVDRSCGEDSDNRRKCYGLQRI